MQQHTHQSGCAFSNEVPSVESAIAIYDYQQNVIMEGTGSSGTDHGESGERALCKYSGSQKFEKTKLTYMFKAWLIEKLDFFGTRRIYHA